MAYAAPPNGLPPAGYAAPPGQYPPGAAPAGYPPAAAAPPGPYSSPPPGAYYAQAPAGYAQPPAGYAQPPAGYGQPPAGYAQPPAGYAQPPAGYAQPPAGYAQPAIAVPGMPGVAVAAGPPGTQVDLRVNGAEVMVLNPPTPYTAPALDGAIASKFPFQNNSMAHSEKNYTAQDGVSPAELKAFFLANSNAPVFRIKVQLWHWEIRKVRDNEGREREERTRRVDYDFIFDPSKWIQAPGVISGLDDSITMFLRSSKQLRRCTMEKTVAFDIGGFHNEIRRIVSERGWLEQVDCVPEYLDNSRMVTVHGAGGCHDLCDSSMCKCLLCITCLCLCWGPMKALCFEDSYTARQEMRITITAHEYANLVRNEIPASFLAREIGIEARNIAAILS